MIEVALSDSDPHTLYSETPNDKTISPYTTLYYSNLKSYVFRLDETTTISFHVLEI